MAAEVGDAAEAIIVTPKDFSKELDELELGMGLNKYEDFFKCPKCSSSLVVLNNKFSKNNAATAILAKGKGGSTEIMSLALSCGNCQHQDLLVNFLVKREIKPITLPSTPYKPFKTPKHWYSEDYNSGIYRPRNWKNSINNNKIKTSKFKTGI